jgi:hypothetical protein
MVAIQTIGLMEKVWESGGRIRRRETIPEEAVAMNGARANEDCLPSGEADSVAHPGVSQLVE